MTTTRQKISIGLIFLGIALGVAGVTAALPRPQGDSHVVYHDNMGVKHPDGDLRGAVKRTTAGWMIAGAVVIFIVGFSVREP